MAQPHGISESSCSMSSGPIRVLIADDHPVVRDGLRRILHSERDIEIVGEASNGSEVVKLVRQLKPDVLLLDLLMPNVSGLEVIRQIRNNNASRILVLTAVTDRKHLLEAVRLQAHGIVNKDAPVDTLLKSIRRIAAGEYWIGRELLAEAVRNTRGASAEKFGLSQRELEIVAVAATGASNKELADRLCISELTVKRHLTNIYEKVGVTSRLELALFAITHNLDMNT